MFLLEVRLTARRLTVNEQDEGSNPLLPAKFVIRYSLILMLLRQNQHRRKPDAVVSSDWLRA